MFGSAMSSYPSKQNSRCLLTDNSQFIKNEQKPSVLNACQYLIEAQIPLRVKGLANAPNSWHIFGQNEVSNVQHRYRKINGVN